MFRDRLRDFNKACDAYGSDRATTWPAALRVSQLVGTKSIWEMTWSFTGPDGRCTFEFLVEDGLLHCQWRRIGDHTIYDRP